MAVPTESQESLFGRATEPASPSASKLLELDPRRLLEVEKFDPTELGKQVAATATASVRARIEAQRATWQGKYEEDSQQLAARIREVCDSDSQEQQAHEALVKRLISKFEASGKKAPPPAPLQSALRGSLRGGRSSLLPPGHRASISTSVRDGSTRASSPVSTRQSVGGGKRMSAKPRASTLIRRQKTPPELEQELDALREVFGEPLSEGMQVRQWGAVLVGQLGLNSYPTRPRRWDSCVARSKRLCKPRVASSFEEAFPASLECATAGSLDAGFSSLSRYMLGSSPEGLEGSSDTLNRKPRPSAHGMRERLQTR